MKTKEEILDSLINKMYEDYQEEFKISPEEIKGTPEYKMQLEAMTEWETQQLQSERERLELAEKLLSLIFHTDFKFSNPPVEYTETLNRWLEIKNSN